MWKHTTNQKQTLVKTGVSTTDVWCFYTQPINSNKSTRAHKKKTCVRKRGIKSLPCHSSTALKVKVVLPRVTTSGPVFIAQENGQQKGHFHYGKRLFISTKKRLSLGISSSFSCVPLLPPPLPTLGLPSSTSLGSKGLRWLMRWLL